MSKILTLFFVLFMAVSDSVYAEEPVLLIEATTVTGDKVTLHPNGKWEYVDINKATAAKKVAAQYPEN